MKTIDELKDAVRAAQRELAKAEAFEAEARERGWSPKGERCVELITVEPMTDVQAYEIMNAHINTDIYSPVGINKIIGLIRAVEARGAVPKRVTRAEVDRVFAKHSHPRLNPKDNDPTYYNTLSRGDMLRFLDELGVEVCGEQPT